MSDIKYIKNALKTKEDIVNKKWCAFKEYEKYLAKEKNINDWLYKNCSHIWEKDDFFCGPYDKPGYICKTCKCSK